MTPREFYLTPLHGLITLILLALALIILLRRGIKSPKDVIRIIIVLALMIYLYLYEDGLSEIIEWLIPLGRIS